MKRIKAKFNLTKIVHTKIRIMFDEDSDELMHEGRREHAWHEWAIRKYGMEQTTSQVRISYVYGGII